MNLIYNLQHRYSKARAGWLKLNNCIVPTPVFMPVATRAAIKGLSFSELVAMDYEIVLSNSYHLYLRPGDKLVKQLGGLHKFMNWKKIILTDSGGFQIFSLTKLRKKISSEGVVFQSHLDGSRHLLTPEKVITIQENLGSNIMMVLDECLNPTSNRAETKKSLELTLAWAKRSVAVKKKNNQQLFGIVQGSFYEDLRKECLEQLLELPFNGYAIGGLSVGETKEEMYRILHFITHQLPDDKPRYLMGVGHPLDILEGVEAGIDMFDSVLPTRNARNGSLLTTNGWLSIKKKVFAEDPNPIDVNCSCLVCANYSRAYLRHLFQSSEILSSQLNTYHNLYFMQNFIRQLRESILQNKFTEFKNNYINNFNLGVK